MIREYVPKPLWGQLKKMIFRPAKKLVFFGRRYHCPVCQSPLRKFTTDENLSLPNFICPVCYSFERHRLAWIFFRQRIPLLESSPKKMLHISPEEGLEARFKEIPNLTYVTGDLNGRSAMARIDLTELPYVENSFDVIYCSHVLEHIPNDRKAVSELRRILKPGGYALIQVFMADEKTVEDPSVRDPADRKRLFGQGDHVRRYGTDFAVRLAEAGFSVRLFSAQEIIGIKDADRMGIPTNETIFFCTK